MVANPNGEMHGVIIPVPVSVMGKAGTYRFVLHFYDDYADTYKNHQVKAALEVNQRVAKQRLDVWVDTYGDPEFRSKIMWEWVSFAFGTVAGIPTIVHPDDTAGPVDKRYLGIGRPPVAFRTLNKQQRKRAAIRTVIVTGCLSGLGNDPGITREGGLSPENPALSIIFTNIVDANLPVDEADPDAEIMRKIGYTNATIHELTHVANDNDSHCAQGIDTCIWRGNINSHFFGYDRNSGTFYGNQTGWRNRISYRFEGELYEYWSPWHSLDEINAMRRSMHYPELRAP